MNVNISNHCQNILASTSSKLLLERVQQVTTQHEELQQCNNNSQNTQYNENVVVAANTRSIPINNETTSYNTSSATPFVAYDENVINTPQLETESSNTQQQQQQTPICRKYYDEGMYLYTSDICTITTNTTTTTTATAIITCYNTGQSLIRNEKYTDAIVHFNMALRNLDPCNFNNSNHNTELAIIEHHIYYNIGYCWYMMQHQQHNHLDYFIYDQPIYFYEMALKVALSYQLEPIHIASTQNAIIVLHLHQKQQYQLQQQQQQQQVQVQVSIQLSIPEQLNILLQCYDVYVDTYGTYSKESATILYNIGRVQVLNHDYYTAIITFEQCLQIRTQIFGNCNENNTHTMDIAVCICSIGQTYHRIGKTDIALDMYTRYMHLNEQFNHVPFHQDLGFILCCMADIYLSKGDVSLAIEKYNYIIQHKTSIYGSNNISCSTNLINVYTKLGDIFYKKQDYHSALQCYMECIRIEGEVSIHKLSMSLPTQQQQNCRVNTVSPNYIVLLFKIADVQRHLKLYDSAGQVYMKLYEIHVSIYGLNSLEVAQILSYMGTTLYDDKKYNMALAYYFDALKIQLIQHSFQDTVIASSTLNCIGLVYFQQRQYMSAELCFTESLRMKIKILGSNHYSNSVLWYNIASTNYELGRHERAISFYLAAIRIERQQCARCVTNDDDNHHNNCVDNQKKNDSQNCRVCQLRCSTRSIQKLGSIYQKQGELEEAMKYYNEALSIELSQNENNNHNSYQNIPTIAKLYNLIGNVHLQLANVQPMMESYIAASRLIRRYHVERNRNDTNNNNNTNNIGNHHNPNRNQGFSIVITGYKLYYLSRMHPPGASAA